MYTSSQSDSYSDWDNEGGGGLPGWNCLFLFKVYDNSYCYDAHCNSCIIIYHDNQNTENNIFEVFICYILHF